MSQAKEFEPLMRAIEKVLDSLGSPAELDQPLRNRVQDLQQKYDEYLECCCFFAQVVPGERAQE
jgi:hypothetical protein